MAWSFGSWFLPDWNGLEWRKSVLAWLEWLGMEEVGFGLNGLEFRKLVLAWLEWFGMKEVGFGLTGMAGNGGSPFGPDSNGL
jgi:hypothetical protein